MAILPNLSIFELELRRAARRPRTFYLRTGYITLLGTLIALAWQYELGGGQEWGRQEEVGRDLFNFFAGLQFLLLNFIAPVGLSDTWGVERRQGTLGVLLACQLGAGEIVLGKLFAGLFETIMAFAAGLPLLLIFQWFGGVSARFILQAEGLTLLSLVLGSTLTLFLSGLFKNRFVILGGTYLALGAYWLASERHSQRHSGRHSHAEEAFRTFFGLLRLDSAPGWREFSYSLLIPAGLSLTFILGAVLTMWAVGGSMGSGFSPWRARRGRQGRQMGLSSAWARGNPLLIRQLGPLRLWRLRWGGRIVTITLLGAIISKFLIFHNSLRPAKMAGGADYFPLIAGLGLLLLGGALLKGLFLARQERENGNWELLLASPLESREIATGHLTAGGLSLLPFWYGWSALLVAVTAAGNLGGKYILEGGISIPAAIGWAAELFGQTWVLLLAGYLAAQLVKNPIGAAVVGLLLALIGQAVCTFLTRLADLSGCPPADCLPDFHFLYRWRPGVDGVSGDLLSAGGLQMAGQLLVAALLLKITFKLLEFMRNR